MSTSFNEKLFITRELVSKHLLATGLSKRWLSQAGNVHYSQLYRFFCDPYICQGPDAEFYKKLLAVDDLFEVPFWDGASRKLLEEMYRLRLFSQFPTVTQQDSAIGGGQPAIS